MVDPKGKSKGHDKNIKGSQINVYVFRDGQAKIFRENV